jgi:hypothetical protein
MSITKSAVTVAAVAMACTSGHALAAKKCDIIGTFTDSLGSSGKFTTEKKGTVSNSAICANPYSLKVTKLTTKIIDVKGTAKSCGALTGNFTFQNGGCTTASGTVTIQGLGSLADTITHTGGSPVQRPPASSMLDTGMH